jgi:hypothetical protein
MSQILGTSVRKFVPKLIDSWILLIGEPQENQKGKGTSLVPHKSPYQSGTGAPIVRPAGGYLGSSSLTTCFITVLICLHRKLIGSGCPCTPTVSNHGVS